MSEAPTHEELLSQLVAESCAASGVPEKVTDKATLLDVVAWLRSSDE